MSPTSTLRQKSDLLRLWEWFAAEIGSQVPASASISHELSPDGREPASLVVNFDTEEHVASAQVWETGNTYLECLNADTEATVLREHLDELDEDDIKKALRRFAAAVLGDQ